MNKNERKSENSVGLFKVEAHLKYLSYFCPITYAFHIFQKGFDSKIY